MGKSVTDTGFSARETVWEWEKKKKKEILPQNGGFYWKKENILKSQFCLSKSQTDKDSGIQLLWNNNEIESMSPQISDVVTARNHKISPFLHESFMYKQ